MGLVGRIIGSRKPGIRSDPNGSGANGAIGDGAIDTLGCVIRAMGDISFQLDGESNPEVFQDLCTEFAGHVENGASVPSRDVFQMSDGTRQWANVRRFFIDRRTDEKDFVTKRLGDYRGVVNELVSGLRLIGKRDLDTEQAIRNDLKFVTNAVDNGQLSDIKAALRQTMENINEIFARQKGEYETQIRELNARMSGMRQDLVAAREEMKRDSLTGTFNRRAFDTAIAQSLNMHFMLCQPVTIILIDLDNFKGINDNFGHTAGDRVLKAVGDCLARSFIRKSDFAARYGGDEFAVILTDTSADNSISLIKRFLQSIAEINIPNADSHIKVSCSLGYTEIQCDDSVDNLIKRADVALYEAKAAGRNCYKFAPPPIAGHLSN